MTVTIELKPETEKRLAAKAKRNGLPMETFIEDILDEKVKDEPKAKSFQRTMSKEEWRKEFREWMDSHKDRGLPYLSDEATRRENIYED